MTVFVQKEQTDVDTYEQDKSDFDSFAAIVRKYLGIRELTLTIANECVRKIIVHAADKPKGYRRKRILLSGALSGNWSRTKRSKPLNGREKARQHSKSLCCFVT